MSRYIDADKIDFNECFVGQSDFARDTREAAQNLIDKQPTADVEPVRHGHWIEKVEEIMTDLFLVYACSECGVESHRQEKYCPHCGAKMDGKDIKQ